MTDRQRGIALVVALVAALLMAMSLVAVTAHLRARMEEHRIEERSVVLATLADGAVARTLAGLSENRHFSGLAPQPLGRGEISSGVAVCGEERVRVVGRARFGGYEEVLEVEVVVGTGDPRVVSWRRRWSPLTAGEDGS